MYSTNTNSLQYAQNLFLPRTFGDYKIDAPALSFNFHYVLYFSRPTAMFRPFRFWITYFLKLCTILHARTLITRKRLGKLARVGCCIRGQHWYDQESKWPYLFH